MWIKVILMMAVVVVVVTGAGEKAGTDKEMMRNAMEHLLQIRPPVSSASASGSSGPSVRTKRQDVSPDDATSAASSPHLYMMELYKKYLTSDTMKTRSNTIRSIIPSRGKNKLIIKPTLKKIRQSLKTSKKTNLKSKNRKRKILKKKKHSFELKEVNRYFLILSPY
jgi:hypothetical protein